MGRSIVNEIGVLAQFEWEKYPIAKKALYKPDAGEYVKGTWAGNPIEVLVIGEDDLIYVTGTQKIDAEWWKANKVPVHTVEMPIGFHKSRLVRWLPVQLSIF